MVKKVDKRYAIKQLDSFKVLNDYAKHHCSPASIEIMLQHLLTDTSESDWLAFISNRNRFKNVVSEIIAIHKNDNLDLATTVMEIKLLVDSTINNIPPYKSIAPYIFNRSKIPWKSRTSLDKKIMKGNSEIALIAISFANSFSKQALNEFFAERTNDVSGYWYNQIIKCNVNNKNAKLIPKKIRYHIDKLQDYFNNPAPIPIEKPLLPNIFHDLFVETTFDDLSKLFIHSHSLTLKLTIPQIKVFLLAFGYKGAKARLNSISKWLSKINVANHDGVFLTENIVNFLRVNKDIKTSLKHLDNLRRLTREGNFNPKNILQRDLEFQRYITEYTWLNSQQALMVSPKTYNDFTKLKNLPPQKYYSISLTDKHKNHAERVAHEAVYLLQYLHKIRRLTQRKIVVVGNDRYGRQWIVEPLQEHLSPSDFSINYFRTPSHMSMRLKVRNKLPSHAQLGFSKQFIVKLSTEMPHLIIVDSASTGINVNEIKYSRATRDYVNWIAAFNHIRSEKVVSQYRNKMQLPNNHIDELIKWHEFTSVCRQIEPWINIGNPYSVRHWAPHKSSTVVLGDFKTKFKDPDFSINEPMVILANPSIYNTKLPDLPQVFYSTKPYYFDGPETLVSETVKFGFGNHGFETRLEGPTTDMFIEAVQNQIKTNILSILTATNN
ncbi:MAG: hypothetical protein FI718_07440 [SAR202 cluster bacterium]|nr:hypothetical protein [Chloroflexota bacterium]MQG39796.1 hypothetical protein [SAR202 cluster bacterium]|tara:strand:+ start:1080 stop:3065 length:1986 start_codon:yes stop_codon:yes gene_type:complete